MEGPPIVALMIPIVVSLGAFLMIWGIRYLENKENMALIAQGMEPSARRRRQDPTRTLKNGFLFIGAGLGLLLALMITKAFGMEDGEQSAVFFGLIAIFGGLGMLAAYFYERRNPPTDKEPDVK